MLFLCFPYFIYCNHVWGSVYETNLNDVVLVQRKLKRIITHQCLNRYLPDIFNDFYTSNRNDRNQVSDLHVPYERFDVRLSSIKIHAANMRNSIQENVKMSESTKIETTSIRVGRRHDGCFKTTNWWHQSSRRDSVPTSVLKNKQWDVYMFLIFQKCDWVVDKVSIDGCMQLSCL